MIRREQWLMNGSERMYRILLGLYPAAHKVEFGEIMLLDFHDLCCAAYERAGLRGLARLWGRTLLDIASSVLTEYIDPQEYPTMNTSFPMQLDRYVLEQRLGVGSVAEVYRAYDPQHERKVALKRVLPDSEARKRALSFEADMLRQLVHPAIPVLYDVVQRADEQYVVMEYLTGTSTLQHMEDAATFLPVPSVLRWAVQVCDALAYMHQQGVVFRDLKPGNILITDAHKAYLVDFGAAMRLDDGLPYAAIGTMGYAAPEQYVGAVEARSDVYALGATLYHLLTKHDPHRENHAFLFHFRPPRALNPTISEALERVILKATEHKPQDRYASMMEMRAALEACMSN
jgi:eukaryotic-like serine/threonine-protein kinase